MSDHLETALRELSRDLRVPTPGPGLTDAVHARLASAPRRPTPRARVGGVRVAWVVAALAAVLLAGTALSPVGAKVAEWFEVHGVMVRDRDAGLPGTPTVPTEPTEPSSPPGTRPTFRPLVPAELGRPDGRSVGAEGRLVSMSWTDGGRTIRLDQLDADLDPMFWKSSPDAEHVLVGGRDAIWFPSPHEVVVTDAGGDPETYPPRLAARTLVVPRDGLTLRLEGDLTLQRAVRIAESLR